MTSIGYYFQRDLSCQYQSFLQCWEFYSIYRKYLSRKVNIKNFQCFQNWKDKYSILPDTNYFKSVKLIKLFRNYIWSVYFEWKSIVTISKPSWIHRHSNQSKKKPNNFLTNQKEFLVPNSQNNKCNTKESMQRLKNCF